MERYPQLLPLQLGRFWPAGRGGCLPPDAVGRTCRNPESWPQIDDLASLAQTMIDAAGIQAPEQVVHGIIDKDERDRLY